MQIWAKIMLNEKLNCDLNCDNYELEKREFSCYCEEYWKKKVWIYTCEHV